MAGSEPPESSPAGSRATWRSRNGCAGTVATSSTARPRRGPSSTTPAQRRWPATRNALSARRPGGTQTAQQHRGPGGPGGGPGAGPLHPTSSGARGGPGETTRTTPGAPPGSVSPPTARTDLEPEPDRSRCGTRPISATWAERARGRRTRTPDTRPRRPTAFRTSFHSMDLHDPHAWIGRGDWTAPPDSAPRAPTGH